MFFFTADSVLGRRPAQLRGPKPKLPSPSTSAQGKRSGREGGHAREVEAIPTLGTTTIAVAEAASSEELVPATRINDGDEDIVKKESNVEFEDYEAPRPGGVAGTSSMLFFCVHDIGKSPPSDSGTLSAIRCIQRGSRTRVVLLDVWKPFFG